MFNISFTCKIKFMSPWLETLNLILIYNVLNSKYDQNFPLIIVFLECALVQKTQLNPNQTKIKYSERLKKNVILSFLFVLDIKSKTNKSCLVPTWAISGNWACIDSRKTKQRTFSICVDMTPFVTLNAPHISNLGNSEHYFGY